MAGSVQTYVGKTKMRAKLLFGVGIGLLVGLFVGVALGWSLGEVVDSPGPEGMSEESEKPDFLVRSRAVVQKPERVRQGSSSAGTDEQKCQERLSDAQGRLQRIAALAEDNSAIIEILEEVVAKHGGAGREGEPMGFPEGLDEAWKEEGFTEMVADLTKKCPEVLSESARVDCSEFPCAIVQTFNEDEEEWNGAACAAFNEVFHRGNSTRGSVIAGPNGEKIHAMIITPKPSGQGVEERLRDYEANLFKRNKARFQEFVSSSRVRLHEDGCNDKNAQSCWQVSQALRERDPEAAALKARESCDLGFGGACNNIAWERCHDEHACDDEALSAARRAAELDPEDGKGAWDTLAYTLCEMGKVLESDEAYRKSCALGYEENCGKLCQ